MLRYDKAEGGGRRLTARNVLSEPAMRGAYLDPMSPPEVNVFVNTQQAQWLPVLETFEASIKK